VGGGGGGGTGMEGPGCPKEYWWAGGQGDHLGGNRAAGAGGHPRGPSAPDNNRGGGGGGLNERGKKGGEKGRALPTAKKKGTQQGNRPESTMEAHAHEWRSWSGRVKAGLDPERKMSAGA